jgi:hypothetical protein
VEHVTFLGRETGSMDPEAGRLYSHEPWAGWGTVGWGFGSMWRDTSLRPAPRKAVAKNSLRPTTAGHPDHQRAAHSAQTYLVLDTARWPKWNRDRASNSGDGVPGTWGSCGYFVCTVCTKCARSVCTKIKCAQFATGVQKKT